MNIGFDAKRYYQNTTGLGNYSRTLIDGLMRKYPQHKYALYHPNNINQKNDVTTMPTSLLNKLMPALWRGWNIKNPINNAKTDIYHGLSNELPLSSKYLKCKKIVTIHDVLFDYFDADYRTLDKNIYKQKTNLAIKNADMIVAISENTKQDLIQQYNAKEEKIKVIYQCTLPIYYTGQLEPPTELTKQFIPQKYLLYVGSITHRKNLMLLCKAWLNLPTELQLTVVIVGDGGAYKAEVKRFLVKNNILNKFIFINETTKNITISELKNLYQNTAILVYPSKKEGYGLPVLEAMALGTPIITSKNTSMEEICKDAALYIENNDETQLTKHIQVILTETKCKEKMKLVADERIKLFLPCDYLTNNMNLYESIL